MSSAPELSTEEVATVKAGFQLIKSEEQAFGEALYTALFAAKPELQNLFGDNQTLLIKKFSEMLGNLSFSASRVSRMSALTRQLGQRHRHYGVDGGDYVLFIDVFVSTFRNTFPDQLTAADEAAWRKFLELICGHMETA